MSDEDILERVICECGDKNVLESIEIFQNTSLPYKKAKKLVTGCNKTCCRVPLRKLFDMIYFGKVDLNEINRQIDLRHDKLANMIENLGPEG
ncbi:MAG: hypothetical protein ACOCP1_01805 [Campylobacterales bacterium]